MTMPEPTVYIVDDDEMLLKSLCWLLESVNLKVEPYHSAQSFLNAFDPSRPGCLLLDIRMPGMSGLELYKELGSKDIAMPVIFFTGHGDVTVAVKCMKAGAFDFIEKPYSEQELLDCIHAAIRQDAAIRENLADKESISQRVESLTPREREVFDLLVEAMTSKQIAVQLGISEKTVEVHRSNIMRKLEVHNAVELVRQAARVSEQH